MPDISILEPRVLLGVVQKFMTGPTGLAGLSLVPRRPHPFSTWQFDVVTGNRNIASVTTPGAMGKIVTKNTIGTLSGGFVYSREKKIFDPTTLHWLRAPGEMAASNAARAVMEELNDLSNRLDRLHEFLVWKMFSGTLSYTRDNTVVSVNYLMSATHKPTAATFWNDPASDPMTDIRTWKQLATHDGNANLTLAYCNSNTMGVIVEHTKIRSMLSDTQKQNYINENVLRRFAGIDWNEYDLGYVDDFTDPTTPVFTTYIPDGYVVFLATENTPWIMLEGPSADDSAPENYTGRFTKTWKEEDPSARQVLMEQSVMPVLLRPEQVVYARIY